MALVLLADGDAADRIENVIQLTGVHIFFNSGGKTSGIFQKTHESVVCGLLLVIGRDHTEWGDPGDADPQGFFLQTGLQAIPEIRRFQLGRGLVRRIDLRGIRFIQ